jgi:hypothetical protein
MVLSARSHFTVTIAAVHRLVTAGFERYFGVLAALGALYWKHLAWGAVTSGATASVLLCFPFLATRGTPLWLVSIALGCEEFLLLSSESESSTAIGTLDRLVLKTHWMASFLRI